MKKYLLILLLFSSSPYSLADVTTRLDITDKIVLSNEIQMLMNKNIKKDYLISLSPNLDFKSTIEGTSKGNGILSIGNFILRIADQHEDQYTYNNTVLSIDINSQKRLISFTGIINVWGETDEKISHHMPLLLLLQYNCKTRLFDKLIDRTGNIVILNQRVKKGPRCNDLHQ